MSAALSPAKVAEKTQSYFATEIRPMLKQWPVRLLLIQFAAELFLPFLIMMTPVPGVAGNLLDVFAAGIALITIMYMLASDRIPAVVLVILGITLIWTMVALFEGQSVAATAWGWWKFFMYPFIGLFAYLTIRWPRGFADWYLKFLIGLMAFEVGVQLIQEALGLGFSVDDRAGTFAKNGVGPQNMFNWFVISFALGAWIASRRWKPVVIALVLGLVASLINGTKFFVPSIAILGLATLGLQLIAGGRLKYVFAFGLVFLMLAAAFVPIYNRFIVEVRGGDRLEAYFEPERLEAYLFNDGGGDRDGTYNLGRMLSLTYGLQLIERDPTTQLFGMGFGTRSSSAGLGIFGIGLENDLYTKASGTGLLTRIQEQGFVGLAVMLLFFFWLMWRFYRDTKVHQDQGLRALEFGLIIFSFLWPLWFWYKNPWASGVMMTLYWVSVGYVFSEIHRRARIRDRARSAPLPAALPPAEAIVVEHAESPMMPVSRANGASHTAAD